MLHRRWLRLTVLLLLAIALPVQTVAAAIMSVHKADGPVHNQLQSETVVVKRDCHGQVIKVTTVAQTVIDTASPAAGEEPAADACPHCTVGCGGFAVALNPIIAGVLVRSVSDQAPYAIAFLSFIGGVLKHPPRG